MNLIEVNNEIRHMVRGLYALQKLRIQMGNRIVANFKAKLGQAPSMPEEELSEEAQAILGKIRVSYDLMTEGAIKFPSKSKFVGDEVISSYAELCLVDQYVQMAKNEEQQGERLKKIVADHPLWTTFLEKVKGCGPTIAAIIISEFDITKAKYASSLHKYAGLDVVIADGRGRSKRKEHLVDVAYKDAEGNEQTKKSITYNPFLKTKLVGVLGPCFLKSKGPYSEIYKGYKNRLENTPAWQDKTPKHRHNAAIRYMVKIFLIDLYKAWRPLENLEVFPPYHEAKLGIFHTTKAA